MDHPSLVAAFFERAKGHADEVALRRKRRGLWEEIRWSDYERRVRALAGGLLSLGVEVGEPVGLISDNRVEWLVSDLGILAAGAVTCALYSTSAAEQIAHPVQHSGLRVVIAENEEQLDKLLRVRQSVAIHRIVVLDKHGLRHFQDPGVVFWEDFLEAGERYASERMNVTEERWMRLGPDDLAILVYTSGTTGPPKGVMLSHGNIDWACRSLRSIIAVQPSDEYLSFLPLCHIAERTITVFNQLLNGSIVNFAESLDTVGQDLSEVRPHVFFAVPRIWEKLYNGVEIRMREAPWGKRRAYAWALSVGGRMRELRSQAARSDKPAPASMPPGLRLQWQLAELTVLRPLRQKLGLDRIRFALSGAAPISPDVIRYFQTLGVPLVEGYGMTESTALITVNFPGFQPPGSVGRAAPELEVKIATDGEILVRSPGVMLGYHKDPAASRGALEDGWLHTGDVGELDEAGRLRFTDRKQDLIITAGGKHIAPQYIESQLRLSPYVHDAVVIGDGRKYVSALLVLDEDNLMGWAQKRRVQFGAYADLVATPEVERLLSTEVERVNRALTHVEAIQRFRILQRQLDRDEGELTPTLKVRRKIVQERYADLIAEMYAACDGPAATG